MGSESFFDLVYGDKLYQKRAREALPLLVRQVKARSPISYSNLAEELGMPNLRNLNYVLGYIGNAFKCISEKWREEVPSIQCLVVNKKTAIPGEGISWFLTKNGDFAGRSLREKREIVKKELNDIFLYTKWSKVLEIVGIEPANPDLTLLLNEDRSVFGKGKSAAHRKLKNYVAYCPETIGLSKNPPKEPQSIT